MSALSPVARSGLRLRRSRSLLEVRMFEVVLFFVGVLVGACVIAAVWGA
jgi:hypothetical protein